MPVQANGCSPSLTVLSEKDKRELFQGVLRVLGDIGMHVYHPHAEAVLRAAGCSLGTAGRIRVPRRLVEESLISAPASIAIYDRLGRQTMDLGGHRTYFGTGSDLMYTLESGTFKRRQSLLTDVARAARVCDALPNIDFIMSFAHAQEVNPHRAYLESFWAMIRNSVKPIVNTAECRDDLAEMWQICQTLRGSESAARGKPYTIHYAEPISPLKHPFHSIDKLIFCAQAGMPVIYSPAPIAGSTAPMTIAGHVVQGIAESLFGLVLHQLVTPGAPFLMGMGPAVLDMRTSQCSYNAPEYLMAYLAMVEMSHYCDLPNWGYAGTSDSQLPDGQATFEAGLATFLSTISGSNLNHDVGYLDFGLTGSLDMVVIMDEIIDQIRRIQRGIPVNELHMAIEVIAVASEKGEFLSQPHTIEHLRSTQWQPNLISREGFDAWSQNGRRDLLDRATRRLAGILDAHRPAAVEAKVRNAIQQRVDAFAPESAPSVI